MLVGAITVWVTFSLFLLVGHLGLRPAIGRVAIGLSGAELVALLGWSYGCQGASCGRASEVARVAAEVDIPLLAALLLVLTAADRVRGARMR